MNRVRFPVSASGFDPWRKHVVHGSTRPRVVCVIDVHGGLGDVLAMLLRAML